ncbi:uncharacterized protein HMPREF1541_03675 [Cyphellophora europaea CBS 101466]|uniref:Ribosomal RNA methyltransferase FtsJ domain-containing protein n=1 Tax=Cyphellophora europaea (strain CBS 101466) TaxID=1220924 RepID=W2S102_CYPE1|nr:uncharacterized protein HMPREF1541_03675 [Cyphellophora europaea CBS 101466]ETN41738.1 hypothetical protein HMPREF1541_03675 [Cyphellophora europaea CBS 101466]
MNLVPQVSADEVATRPDKTTNSESIWAKTAVTAYLREHVKEFCYLGELRAKGWANPQGDEHFRNQRKNADKADTKTARYFYGMMKAIAKQLHDKTGAFQIYPQGHPIDVLDLCMAPGGFVSFVLETQRVAIARGFSLPVEQGGHEVLVESDKLDVTFTDITMLGGDMGVIEADIPSAHPDAGDFRLQKLLTDGDKFDLVFCDGQVLRTHQRSPWREAREARRLSLVQLSLGLEHVRPGGTIVILLHKLEAWENLQLLQKLHQFSEVQLFKSPKYHATRSSFYAVATKIQSNHPLAVHMVATWKQQWKVATFGTAEEYRQAVQENGSDAAAVLEVFGKAYVQMGRHIWATQATALSKAPYIR